jgi:hypothetical protein
MLCKSYAGATGPVPILPQASSTLNQRAAFPGSPYFCSTPEQFRLTFAEYVTCITDAQIIAAFDGTSGE